MMKTNTLKASSARIIYNDECQDILQLSVQKIFELFKKFGFLLFRDFEVSHQQMKAFAEQFSSGFILDKDRPVVDLRNRFVTLVNPGKHYVSPHCENANSPFRPDVVWFCCATPAVQGGETLVWDGVQVWERLSEELRQLFISRRIKFLQTFPSADWKRFLGSNATLAGVRQVLDGFEGLNYQINADQSIALEYVCSAVVKTKYGNQNAFANSLMSEHKNPRGIVTFEDDSPIPNTIINEIRNVTNRLTEEVQWQTGDLVMIDNSRFLHGRRAFNDARRRIFSLLSYLRD